jgi:signal transduction histidine kinase
VWLLDRFRQKYGVRTNFESDKKTKPLSEGIRIVLFQAVRELLINVQKHAKARHVKVGVRKERRTIIIKVEDDGLGFSPEQAIASAHVSGGFGLFNIRERLTHLGGKLVLDSAIGKGTFTTLIAPLTSTRKHRL